MGDGDNASGELKAGTLTGGSSQYRDSQWRGALIQTLSLSDVLVSKLTSVIRCIYPVKEKMAAEVEETLKRLVGHKGVIGTVVVNKV